MYFREILEYSSALLFQMTEDIWQFSMGLKPDIAFCRSRPLVHFLQTVYVPPHSTAAHQVAELDITFQLPNQLLKNQKDFCYFSDLEKVYKSTAEREDKGGKHQNPFPYPPSCQPPSIWPWM